LVIRLLDLAEVSENKGYLCFQGIILGIYVERFEEGVPVEVLVKTGDIMLSL
jgi:hypothetical protein